MVDTDLEKEALSILGAKSRNHSVEEKTRRKRRRKKEKKRGKKKNGKTSFLELMRPEVNLVKRLTKIFCLRLQLVSWEQRIMMTTQSGSLKSYLRGTARVDRIEIRCDFCAWLYWKCQQVITSAWNSVLRIRLYPVFKGIAPTCLTYSLFLLAVSIGGGCPDEVGGGGFGACPHDCSNNSDCSQNNSLCCPAACGGNRCLVRCPKLSCSKACSTGYVLSNSCPTCACKGDQYSLCLSFDLIFIHIPLIFPLFLFFFQTLSV